MVAFGINTDTVWVIACEKESLELIEYWLSYFATSSTVDDGGSSKLE